MTSQPTCPDCKGTGIYRGLNHEEPCPTCCGELPGEDEILRAMCNGLADRAVEKWGLDLPADAVVEGVHVEIQHADEMKLGLRRDLAERCAEDLRKAFALEMAEHHPIQQYRVPGGIPSHLIKFVQPGELTEAIDSMKIGEFVGSVDPVAVAENKGVLWIFTRIPHPEAPRGRVVIADSVKVKEVAPAAYAPVCDRPDIWPAAPLQPTLEQLSQLNEIIYSEQAQKLGKTARMRLDRLARTLEASEEARRVFFGVDVGTEPSKTVRAIVRVDPNGSMTVEQVLPDDWVATHISNTGFLMDSPRDLSTWVKAADKTISQPTTDDPEQLREWQSCLTAFQISRREWFRNRELARSLFPEDTGESAAKGFLQVLTANRPELHDAEIFAIGYEIREDALCAIVHHPSLKHDRGEFEIPTERLSLKPIVRECGGR